MSRRDQFERELCFRDDGHVSDLVVSALADGQSEFVVDEAAEHVDECELCTDRLLQMATLSISLGHELRAAHPERAIAPELVVDSGRAASLEPARRAPSWPPAHVLGAGVAFPAKFFFLAIALAALGVVPALPRLWQGGDAVRSLVGAGHELLAFARGVRVVFPVVVGHSGGLLLVASLFTTLLCVSGGWLLARSTPAAAFERRVG